MSDFALSATLKGGTGYDSPWVVVYGNTPDELKQRLAGVVEAGVLQATVDAANTLKGVNNAAPLTAPQEAQAAQQPQAQPQQSAWGGQQQAAPASNGAPQNGQPHPEGITCPTCNSVVQFKLITRRSDGRQFKMWSCPNQKSKNDGHYSQFAN